MRVKMLLWKWGMVRQRDKFNQWVSRHIPSYFVYWSLIHAGVKSIRNDETVPDVTFTDVLSRSGTEHYKVGRNR
jgi:hypothetical protein